MRTSACTHLNLRVWKASRASGVKVTGSDFLSLFSPLVRSYRGVAIMAKPIMTHCSCEGANVSEGLRDQALQDGGHILMRWFDSIITDMMSQVNDLRFKQITLGRFQLEAMFPEAFKNYLHPLQMLFWVFGVNYHII